MTKKSIALTLRFLISGGLIWFLLSKVDITSAKDKLLSAHVWMLALAIFFLIIQVAICTFRWRAVLTAIEESLSFPKAFQFYLIGLFFNQALPSDVGGDAVRVHKAYRSGLSPLGAVNGVMLERVASVLGMILLMVMATRFFLYRVGPDEAEWIVPAVGLLGLGSVAGLSVLMFLDRLPWRHSHWRVVRALTRLAADTRRVFLVPMHAIRVIGWSLFGHANIALVVYLMALSLSLEVTWLDCMVLMPLVFLVMIALPISIAGWGIREGAMVTAFGLIGVPYEGALALSFMYGLSGLVMALPGGIVWLLSSDRKIEKIEETPADA